MSVCVGPIVSPAIGPLSDFRISKENFKKYINLLSLTISIIFSFPIILKFFIANISLI